MYKSLVNTYREMLMEAAEKNYRADGVFSHDTPKKLGAPKAGSPLYHITASHIKDGKFQEKESHPVTWFTSGSKGYNGHKEIEAGYHNGPSSNDHQDIHIRKLKSGVKLANEHEVRQSMAALSGKHPDEHKGDPVYSHLDRNVGEYSHKEVDGLVNHLKSRGFHGVVHADFSMADTDKDMHSVALFHPNKHSEHVKTVTTPEEMNKHQKDYEKNGS